MKFANVSGRVEMKKSARRATETDVVVVECERGDAERERSKVTGSRHVVNNFRSARRRTANRLLPAVVDGDFFSDGSVLANRMDTADILAIDARRSTSLSQLTSSKSYFYSHCTFSRKPASNCLTSRGNIQNWKWFWSAVLLLLATVAIRGSAERADNGVVDSAHVTVVLVGEPVTLPCDVRTETCGPAHSIKWYKNEQRVYLYSEMGKVDRADGDMAVAGQRISFVFNATPPFFHLQWTELADEAQYRCEVTYLRVQDSCPTSTLLNLTVLDPPSLPEVTMNETPLKNGTKLAARLEGDRVNLTCTSQGGKPAARATWWLGQQALTSNPSSVAHKRLYSVHEEFTLREDLRWTTVSTLELTVSRDQLSENKLECRINHEALDVPYSAWFQLDVRVKPSSLELLGPRQPVIAGSLVMMTCTAEGAKPAANITWINGTSSRLRILPKVDITLSDFNTYRTESRLTFNASRFEHVTNFTCRATNSVLRQRNLPPMEQSILLEVLHPPIPWITPNGNVTIKEQDSVTLTCDFVANPPNLTRIVWLKGNEPLVLVENHEAQVDVDTGRPRLLIRNVTRTDQGDYRCTLENIAGPGTSAGRASLGIQHSPEVQIAIHPATLNETTRSQVRLRCDVVRANPHSVDRVKWYTNGKFMNETVSNELLLTSVSRHHHGDYSCKAHNIAGWGVLSQAKHLVVNYPPGQSYLTYTPKVVVKRESVTLTCSVDDLGRPPVSHYRWMRGKRLIKEVTTANWTIEPVTLSTEGNFSCVGVNDVGEGKSADTYIDVHATPTFIDRLPHYQGVLVTTNSLSMTCRVECDPACYVQWLRNELLIEPSQYYSIVSGTLPPDPSTDDFQSANSTLTWNLSAWPGGKLDRYYDNANFTCRSTDNSVGLGVSSTAYFRVEYQPENITVLPNTLDVVEGEQADRLRCKAVAYPESTYLWLQGNHTVGRGDVLRLPGPMSRERGGLYTCVATNGRGNISASAWINVLYKPDCRITYQSTTKNKVRLACEATANPRTVQFTWTLGNMTLLDEIVDTRKGHSVLPIPNSPNYIGTYFCAANNSVGVSLLCSFDNAGWASETQGWLEKLGDDNLLMISVVVGGVTVFVIIVCSVIVLVARRRRSRGKYNDSVELEEREKFLPFSPDGQAQLPDGAGPGRPTPLNPSVLPHTCNGSEIKVPENGGVPTLYKQICPGVLLPYTKRIDCLKDVPDNYTIGKTHPIVEHDTPNKKHTLRTKPDGTTYPDLPIVLDINHKVNTSAWGSQHEDFKAIEFLPAPYV